MGSLLKASLFSLVAVAAFGQRGGMHINVPLPASSRGLPNGHFGFNTPHRHAFRGGFLPWYGLDYPWLGGYDYGYDYQPEPSPVVVVAPPPAPPQVIVQAPPKPIHGEIKEYPTPPETGDSSPFSIALKDGTVRSAAAVWITDDTLHYIGAEGKPGQVALESVDRQATRKLNTGKNVRSWLP